MTDLTLEFIEMHTTNSNLERGRSYFLSGQVSDFQIINGRLVQAKVNGNKSYRVFFEITDEGYKGFCSCPYNSKGYCKHQVAVKFALLKTPDEAEIVSISKQNANLLKFYNRFLYFFYKTKYKLF